MPPPGATTWVRLKSSSAFSIADRALISCAFLSPRSRHVRSSRRYYRALDPASASTVSFSPYAPGAEPVRFSYDKSFNYQPRAYERPGPVVEIHRLAGCTPSVR